MVRWWRCFLAAAVGLRGVHCLLASAAQEICTYPQPRDAKVGLHTACASLGFCIRDTVYIKWAIVCREDQILDTYIRRTEIATIVGLA